MLLLLWSLFLMVRWLVRSLLLLFPCCPSLAPLALFSVLHRRKSLPLLLQFSPSLAPLAVLAVLDALDSLALPAPR